MLGWRDFAKASPNDGHYALAQLETMGKIGVTFEDSKDFYRPNCEESELNFAFSAFEYSSCIIHGGINSSA